MHFNISPGKTKKILILTAIPKGLRLDIEVRSIEEAIRRALQRDRFVIQVRTAIRPRDFRRVIAEEKPFIVHFCGHGLENGDLMLEDDNGHPKTVTPVALAQLFKLHSKYVHCVVLNACHSEQTAKAISQHIQYVIGMNQAINDTSAIVFSQGFYDALGYENKDIYEEIERAFEEGKIAIAIEGVSGLQTPVLQRRFSYPLPPKPLSPSPDPNNGDNGSLEPEKPPLMGGYRQLREYLQAGQFRLADQETAKLVLTLTNRLEEGWLRSHDIEQLPCPDFRILDNLWVRFSNGRFGFSVQRDLWLSLGAQPGDFNGQLFRTFSDRLGWRINNEWITYDQFNFSTSAATGHLPSLQFSTTRGMNSLDIWKANLKSFLAISEKCLFN